MGRKISEKTKRTLAQQIGGRITRVREARGLDLGEAARKLNPPKTKQSMHAYENGAVRLGYEQLIDIAAALQTTVHYLATGQGYPDVVTSSPLEVVASGGRPVPVYNFATGNVETDEVAIAPYIATNQDGMAMCFDESMVPEFRPGDEVYFRQGMKPTPRDFVWAKDNASGEYLLRQYRQVRSPEQARTSFLLKALGEEWPDTPEAPQVEIIGVVISKTRKYKAV